jgi:hypothetical protein
MKGTLEPTAAAYLICVPGANMYLVAVIDSMLYYLSLRGRISISTKMNRFVFKGGDSNIHPPSQIV